jgi:type IV pilus assembly protein PilM
MASGSVWGIDIGKSSLKAVRMRRGKEELEVQALFYEEYTPGADGVIPPSEASRALEALVAKHPETKKEPVYVALAGHAAFSRFIKLPAFDPKKLGEMVRFEAQQQIPFPIADVNWDYALVEREYEADEDREVGLFAIKKEIVYAFIADLTLTGLEPYGITTGPLAIYNFIRWDMELPEDQATVALDIGWDHTDLVILDGERYWIRNLALNGAELTKAISAKLKVGFSDAEEQKRKAAESKESRRLYQATEVILKDFVAEIQRSIAFYKAQNKDRQVAVGQVLLLGNGSKLPNIRPYFQKELGIPVETVRRLNGLALDVDIDGDEVELLKEHLPSFAVAFGLGIQGCGEALADVNLLPEEIRRRQALEKKKPIVAAAVAVVWLTAILSYMTADKTLSKVSDVLKETSRNLSWLKDNDEKRGASRGPIPALEKELKELAGLTTARNLPLEVLNKLAPVLPAKNGEVTAPSDQQRKTLQQGKQIAKINAVERELASAQAQLNNAKTWLVDLDLKTLSVEDPKTKEARAVVRCSLLVARKYVINAQGLEDEGATKLALETGILADVKRVFPKAGFEGAPRKIWNLDKDQAAPTAGFPGMPGGAASLPTFCALTIVIEYDGSDVSVASGGRAAAEAPR